MLQEYLVSVTSFIVNYSLISLLCFNLTKCFFPCLWSHCMEFCCQSILKNKEWVSIILHSGQFTSKMISKQCAKMENKTKNYLRCVFALDYNHNHTLTFESALTSKHVSGFLGYSPALGSRSESVWVAWPEMSCSSFGLLVKWGALAINVLPFVMVLLIFEVLLCNSQCCYLSLWSLTGCQTISGSPNQGHYLGWLKLAYIDVIIWADSLSKFAESVELLHNWWEGTLVWRVGVMFPHSYLENKACTQFLIFELLKARSVALIIIGFDNTGVSNWVNIRHPFLSPPWVMIYTSFSCYLQEMAYIILHHLGLKGSYQWAARKLL